MFSSLSHYQFISDTIQDSRSGDTLIFLNNSPFSLAKDENIRKIMKEIEQLSEDSNKIHQISDLAASLR